MRLLLVAATVFEIRPFLERLPLTGRQDEQLSTYQYKDVTIDILIPGVGMVPTAFFLGRQLAVQHYDMAVNAGIAGTFNRALPLGSVVNVTEDCIPELGAEDGNKFLTVFELGLVDADVLPYRGGKLLNEPINELSPARSALIESLPKVKGITSNTVRGNLQSIERIRQLAMADIESMEGAAFMYGCLSEKVPCLQLRAISNFVEERDKSRWNLALALKNLNRLLWEIATSHS